MSSSEAMRRHAGTLGAGLVSFLALLALMRWSNGEPLVQPSSDLGIVIGVALVALFFAMSDGGKVSK